MNSQFLITPHAGRAFVQRPILPRLSLVGSLMSNAVIIIRAEHEGKVGYTFLESWRFKMEYWRGNTGRGEYEIRINLIG